MKTALVTAGIPNLSPTFYREIRFLAMDPAALIEFDGVLNISEAQETPLSNRNGRKSTRLLILRDIETERAVESAAVDFVASPREFSPAGGLSGDRETATSQALAEALRRYGVTNVIADRTLPFLFVEAIRAVGMNALCDPDRGVIERRRKDRAELDAIRAAQCATETVMESVCRRILAASVEADGTLFDTDGPLTSERVRAWIDHALLDLGFTNPPSIVAGKNAGGDCHGLGKGILRTQEPIIIDIFPQSNATHYCGDSTRTIFHGGIPKEYLPAMAAVKAAKQAATATLRAGVTGETVHRAAIDALEEHQFGYALPTSEVAKKFPRQTHGTGHGLGLACHEPPLLDFGGPLLVEGDVVTIEPGLYRPGWGGVRIEDLFVVTATGCENLGLPLPEELS